MKNSPGIFPGLGHSCRMSCIPAFIIISCCLRTVSSISARALLMSPLHLASGILATATETARDSLIHPLSESRMIICSASCCLSFSFLVSSILSIFFCSSQKMRPITALGIDAAAKIIFNVSIYPPSGHTKQFVVRCAINVFL